jgi:GntR family transcriptional repressor for pyruvate dehydrogenase complex
MMMKIGQPEGTRDLMEVREIIEPGIAALAALRATPEHIATMQEAINVMDAAITNAATFIEADLDFHLGLAEASQNMLIPTLLDFIVDLLREQRMGIFNVTGGPERGQEHHKRILQAVKDHNPQAAGQAMEDHLAQVRQDSQEAG